MKPLLSKLLRLLPLGISLLLLGSFLACQVQEPDGVPAKELRFDAIADSLRLAGYTHLEISAQKVGSTSPVILYNEELNATNKPGVIPLPDSLGSDFSITLKATKPVNQVFTKVYTVRSGKIVGPPVVTKPETTTTVIPPVKEDTLPKSIVITPTLLNLVDGGDTATLQATALPQNVPHAVLWSSSNPSVASIGTDGKVTSGAVGVAVVTAQSQLYPELKATLSISVLAKVTVTQIIVAQETLLIYTGDAPKTLEVSVLPVGSPVLVNWVSSAPAIATVSADGRVTGLVPGTAFIIAASKSDALVKDSCRVTVIKDAPTIVAGQDVTIQKGESVAFTPTVNQSYGGIAEFRWSLDGDTLWDDTSTLIPGNLSRTYPSAGIFKAYFWVKDGEGNVATATRTVTVLGSTPLVNIVSPAEGQYVKSSPVKVSYQVNGTALEKSFPLVEGANTLTIDTTLDGIKGTAKVNVVLDTKPPVILITSPADGLVTNKASIAVAWSVDGVAQTTQLTESLPVEGENIIKRKAVDAAGNADSAMVKVIRDTKGSSVLITSPANGSVTNKSSIAVAWSVDGKAQTTLLTEALNGADGEFVIIREATDTAGNKSADTVRVTKDTKAPVVVITSPAANAKVASSPVTVAWTVDGVAQTTLLSETLSAGDGNKTITRIGTDAAGNTDTASVTIVLDKDKPGTPVMTAATTPTNLASVVWKWTSGGNGNGTYRYRVDNPDLTTGTTTVTTTQATVAGLADGAHTLYVQESDAQGNWSTSASQAIVVDRTAPTIAIDGGNQTVAAAAFTASAAVTDANGVATVSIAGASAGNGAMTLSGGKYTKAVTLASGANTLTVTATDAAGNSRTASVTVTFTLPAIAISYPPDGFVTNNGSITVSYTVGTNTTVKTKAIVLADGQQTVTISETGAQSKSITVYVYSNVVFVRKAAPAGGNGSSWDNAFNDLAAALRSTPGKKSGNQLWISAASYNNVDDGSSGFFDVATGVSLYGGFPATGRPFTTAGRNFTANKTIFTCGVTWGGILRLAGGSTVDGIVFNQNVAGPQTVYVNVSAIFANCEFHSTGSPAGQPNDFIYVRDASVSFDNCTFSNISSVGAIINLWGSDAAITASRFTTNSCRYLVYLDGREVSLSNSTINGNTSWDPDISFPAFKIWNGSFRNLGGNVSDKAFLQTDG